MSAASPEYIEAFYDGVHETLRQLKRDLGGEPLVDEWVAERMTELEVDAEAARSPGETQS